MSTHTQRPNCFILEELKFLPKQLRKWCANRHLSAVIPEAWAEGKAMVISNDTKSLEIALVGPESFDSVSRLYGIWGLRVDNNVLCFWPAEGWKILGPAGRKRIDNFGDYLEHCLSEFFGIRSSAAQ